MTSVGAVWQAFSPGVIVNLGPIRNPLGIEGLPKANDPVQAIMFALMFVAVVSSLLVRLRRARGIERQQVKWAAYTAVMAASGSVLTYTIAEAMAAPWLEWTGFVILIAALVSFPISAGIAIARYRLYGIDFINRTLFYSSRTATLVALYFGGIVVLQRIFVLLTGQQSTLAVVASTLLVAALFTPLRRRIQGFIDRRFYRRKYDARKGSGSLLAPVAQRNRPART